jgi:hypothetical protein
MKTTVILYIPVFSIDMPEPEVQISFETYEGCVGYMSSMGYTDGEYTISKIETEVQEVVMLKKKLLC